MRILWLTVSKAFRRSQKIAIECSFLSSSVPRTWCIPVRWTWCSPVSRTWCSPVQGHDVVLFHGHDVVLSQEHSVVLSLEHDVVLSLRNGVLLSQVYSCLEYFFPFLRGRFTLRRRFMWEWNNFKSSIPKNYKVLPDTRTYHAYRTYTFKFFNFKKSRGP